jgi:NAD-dependent SIR2 family protein deacetylase
MREIKTLVTWHDNAVICMTETSYENTIFLFGAGLSLRAGIPTIKEMTERFLKNPFHQVSEMKRQEFNFTKSHIETLASLTKLLWH